MSNMSKYAEQKTLQTLLGGSTYVGLYTSNPGENDTGTEVSGGGYTRQSVTFSPPNVEAGRTSCVNVGDIVYPKATEDWGAISHLGIRDAASGGNLLYYKAISTTVNVKKGSEVRIKSGDLKVSQD